MPQMRARDAAVAGCRERPQSRSFQTVNKTEKKETLEERVALVLGVLKSAETAKLAEIENRTGLSRFVCIGVLKYLKRTGMAHNKQMWTKQGNSYQMWSIYPIERKPSREEIRKKYITEEDLEWMKYYKTPREKRRNMQKPGG